MLQHKKHINIHFNFRVIDYKLCVCVCVLTSQQQTAIRKPLLRSETGYQNDAVDDIKHRKQGHNFCRICFHN